MKSNEEWLAETIESAPITKIKLAIIGQILLKKDKLPEEQK